MNYVQIADGHDNMAGYQRFLTDPWTPQLVPGIQRISLAGVPSEDGFYTTELRWLPKVPQSVVSDVLTKCGLSAAALSNEVTLYLPTNEDRSTWDDFNATVWWSNKADSEFERSGRPLIIGVLALETI